MYLLASFILQNFRKVLMRMYHFLAKNDPFVRKFFSVQTIIITFIYLLAPFIQQNSKKFLEPI